MDNPKRHPTAFFETLAHEAIMGIIAFEMTEDGKANRLIYCNRLAKETLEIGTSGVEVEADTTIDASLKFEDFLPGEGKTTLARPLTGDMLKHEGLYQDVLMRKKNGMSFIANVGVKRRETPDGKHQLLLMFQDITIQKKLQREIQAKQEEIHNAFSALLEQNRQLKELDLAKDRFIALTTHELRTPLSAIVATAEVLSLKFYESEEQKEEFIRTIHEQGLHLMELVNDILDFAKIRAGKMEFYVEQVDLLPIVEKLARNFDHMALQAKVTVEIDRPKEPVRAYVDVLRLKEVLNNVINNAIKYNKIGGRVIVSLQTNGNFARVMVEDTGQGIADSKLQHVFNEFETVGSVSRHHKGTGLGMPISKSLMQAMGGDLTLESQEGVGSKFYADIPTTKVLPDDVYRSRVDDLDDLAA